MSGVGRITLVSTPGSMVAVVRDLPVTEVNPADLPGGPNRIAHHLAGLGTDLVVFGPGLPLDVIMATARDLEQSFPEIDMVLVHPLTSSLLGDAMWAGIRQVLSPDDGSAIADAVVRLATAAALRRTRLGGGTDHQPGTSDEGQLIAVMAAKGGVGRTTVAVNVALELARGSTNNVVLVDLDLVAGECGHLLGLEPRASLATMGVPGLPLDPTVLKLSLTPHPSGLLVLPSPDNLVESDAVDLERVHEVLRLLKASFPIVVVDTAPGAGGPMTAAAELADDLVVIGTPDLGGLRSLRQNLDGLNMLGLTRARRRFVMNRSDLRTGLTTQAMENTVGLPVSHSIPECREVAVAANQSTALVDAYPKTEAVRVLRELVASIRPTSVPAGSGPGAKTQRHLGAA
jgi:pilus assembly protein CpaE